MAELALGLAQSALEKLASRAYEEISLAKSAKADLKELNETMVILKSVLYDAEKKQSYNEELRTWLVRLKDVLNDAVDVVDEFECEALRRQVVRDFASFGRKVRRFFSSSNQVVFRFSIARRVRDIKERLAEIAQDMAQFELIRSQLGGVLDQEDVDRATHSYVGASEVIGRDDDKAVVVNMLMRREEGDNLSIVPIVGLGGLGKTTLAKLAFNDECVAREFDLRIWVCVSLDFDVPRLLREILKSASNNAGGDLISLSLDRLQASVVEALAGKNFLLVLDDVWNEDRIKWLELSQFLTSGCEGSKVIVTTRSTLVSSIMTTTPPHQLKGLSEEDSLSLFFRSAFGDERLAEINPRLKNIGKEIANKCGGLPLALRALGCLLHSKSEEKWISVRDCEVWELEREDDRILPALQLSYNMMSACTKQCFAYCSMFEEDETMTSFNLILIWMALGILHQPNAKTELEDIGRLQLHELCYRSFFQCNDDVDDTDQTFYGLSYSYTMHDLIHDLARSIAKSDYSIVKSREEDLSNNNIRYLRLFRAQNNLKRVQELAKLRSVHIENDMSESNMDGTFLWTCVKQFKYLRVFDLRESSIEVLPSSIGKLKHLRYLNLSQNKRIKRLPFSVFELQSLQVYFFMDAMSSRSCLEILEIWSASECSQ